MEQLDLLWRYQEIELELAQHENDRKNSIVRQKLIKLKNYLVDQQNILYKMNNTADEKKKQFDILKQGCQDISNRMKNDQDRLYDGSIKSVQQLEKFVSGAEAIRQELTQKENQLTELMAQIDSFSQKLRDIGMKMAKARKEYEQLKKEYDDEVQTVTDRLEILQKDQKEIAAMIDKGLLTKYNHLMVNRNSAMATIDAEKCSGCNMSLPSLVIRNVKDSKKIIECENCGRILYSL